MSFSNNIAARGGLKGWWRQHGGRSLAGKIYLPVDPAPPTEERAVATNADSSDSKNLPATGATPDADHLPVDGTAAPARADARPTVAKLGLRDER
jgi:hypothetical protein